MCFVHLLAYSFQPANSYLCADDATEVHKLRESLKNSISLTVLATKLDERDAQHAEDTRGLQVQARKAEGLQQEVDRLKGREEELMR